MANLSCVSQSIDEVIAGAGFGREEMGRKWGRQWNMRQNVCRPKDSQGVKTMYAKESVPAETREQDPKMYAQ